jgi:hypothetical protein
MAITLDQIKLQARQRADMENQPLIGEDELTNYVNNSIAELYDLLCEAYGSDYYVTTIEGQILANVMSYPLPDDFYELKGVDLRIENNAWQTIERYNFNERNRYPDGAVWNLFGYTNIRYRIVGNNIQFTPTPDSNYDYRLHYVPLPTKLVNGTDTLDDLNAYSEYVIVDVAIKMLTKEESDASIFLAQKEALKKRIVDKAANRDASIADTVNDIYAQNDYWYWRPR